MGQELHLLALEEEDTSRVVLWTLEVEVVENTGIFSYVMFSDGAV